MQPQPSDAIVHVPWQHYQTTGGGAVSVDTICELFVVGVALFQN